MRGTIFISYRRGDEPGFAHALYARLEHAFSADRLFMDVEGGIPAGVDFIEMLDAQVVRCDVLLALIGQGWLTARDEAGAYRLDNPDDFVRIEIESALRRGKRVIPVLINRTEMPRATDLPATLQALARRNAVRLTQERFKADVQGLIAALEGALRNADEVRRETGKSAEKDRPSKRAKRKDALSRRSLLYGLGGATILTGAGGVGWMLQSKAPEPFERFPGKRRRFASVIAAFSGHSYLISSVAFSPTGYTVLSSSFDGVIKLWELATSREILTFKDDRRFVYSVVFSPDGRSALSAGETLKLWDLATGKEVHTFTGHSATVNSVAVSPDGRSFLTASNDKTIKMWELAPSVELRTFRGHSDAVRAVAFSRDGRTALSASEDTTLKLWDLTTGKEVHTFTGHSARVNSVAVSPDGRRFLSAGDDALKLWDVETGRELRNFVGSFYTVAFSPDGGTVLSGGKELLLWDDLTGHKEPYNFGDDLNFLSVRCVAFSPDGRKALSDNRYLVKVWDLSTL